MVAEKRVQVVFTLVSPSKCLEYVEKMNLFKLFTGKMNNCNHSGGIHVLLVLLLLCVHACKHCCIGQKDLPFQKFSILIVPAK